MSANNEQQYQQQHTMCYFKEISEFFKENSISLFSDRTESRKYTDGIFFIFCKRSIYYVPIQNLLTKMQFYFQFSLVVFLFLVCLFIYSFKAHTILHNDRTTFSTYFLEKKKAKKNETTKQQQHVSHNIFVSNTYSNIVIEYYFVFTHDNMVSVVHFRPGNIYRI